MKEIVNHLQRKSWIREVINCWLRYQLAQPVDFDLPILIHFAFDYSGVTAVKRLTERMRSYVPSLPSFHVDRLWNTLAGMAYIELDAQPVPERS